MLSLNNFRKSFVSALSTIYSTIEAETMFWWCLEEFGQLTRMQTIGNENQTLSEDIVKQLELALAQLQQHRPIQYVLEKAWFRNFTFDVNESVLIPRPETEELVVLVLQHLSHSAPTIFEIGTGSGCIAISLEKELKNSTVVACDISIAALNVARKNAVQLQSVVEFLELDILQPISSFEQLGMFNCIVSNPPYVCLREKAEMRQNVLNFEPHSALFVPDNNPLLFYEAISNFAVQHLVADGIVALEINEQFGHQTAALFFDRGFKTASVINDLFDKPRFVVAKK